MPQENFQKYDKITEKILFHSCITAKKSTDNRGGMQTLGTASGGRYCKAKPNLRVSLVPREALSC